MPDHSEMGWHFFNLGFSYLSEINDSRTDIWLSVLATSNPISGNGLGSANLLISGSDRFNTESYLLTIYYEGGLILLSSFLAFFVLNLQQKINIKVKKSVIKKFSFFALFFLYAFTVNAYFSVSLAFIWLLFVSAKKFDLEQNILISNNSLSRFPDKNF